MRSTPVIQRAEALSRLEILGVQGPQVYLLDIVPLCEMALCDGELHAAERAAILSFATQHIAWLNRQAGVEVCAPADALPFVDWVLAQSPETLKELRSLMRVVCLEGPTAERRLRRLLDAAESVGAAAVSPREPQHRWDTREIDCIWDLQDDLLRHLQTEAPAAGDSH